MIKQQLASRTSDRFPTSDVAAFQGKVPAAVRLVAKLACIEVSGVELTQDDGGKRDENGVVGAQEKRKNEELLRDHLPVLHTCD